MTIYIDGVLMLNFVFDFLLLFTTGLSLKRNISFLNLILGSFIGSLSTLILFFNITSIQLFIIKVYLSILMCLFTFGYKDIKYTVVNIGVFYVVSILFGGFMYLLNLEFSYKHVGFVFYHKGISINVIFLFIISPIILYIYIRQTSFFRRKVNESYDVTLMVSKYNFKLKGYMDTGNVLTFKNRPVIITNLPNEFRLKKYYVPYNTINQSGLLECVRACVSFELGCFDVYLGFSDKFNMSGIDVLLNNLMEGENVKKNNKFFKKNNYR